MKVFLVYGLNHYDLCVESYVKAVFKDEEKAQKYLTERSTASDTNKRDWRIEDIELE